MILNISLEEVEFLLQAVDTEIARLASLDNPPDYLISSYKRLRNHLLFYHNKC